MNQSLWTTHQSWPVGVQFDPVLDRCNHRLLLRNGEDVSVIAESIEGLDHESWPCSPVLQQVEPCPLSDDRQGVVAVGLGGTSHWSMAVEGDCRDGLIFDVACRVSEQPTFLGSTYRSQHKIETKGDSFVELVFKPLAGRRIGFEVLQGRLKTSPDDGRLAVVADLAAESFPTTVRWRYRVFLVESTSPG